MKAKMYSDGKQEFVHPLEYWQEDVNDGCGDMVVEEMRRDYGGEMWCTYWADFIVDKGSCGKLVCKQYRPCNGKNGRCRELTWGYVGTGNKIILTPEFLEGRGK